MELDKHIRLYDPAIDWTRETGTPLEWARSRDSSVKLRPGRAPVIFHCARLGRRAFTWCGAATDETEKLFRAFRACVRRVEHPTHTWQPQGVEGREYIAMTEAESEVYGIADVLEIGGLAWERSVLPTDCEGGYTPRPTSLLVLDATLQASLRAERGRATPAPTASEPEVA